ncbi:hypothetical protein L6654_24135 [Bradyrhizobium sp. WYCCWR 13023]|uniref:Uncharacterized protein n=1 Tax=Bradyrhizobium zhengyangense TaxID=2911009 RepID=A0A9X1UIG2_9BRAD|nr:hypothetical protein [Bradyrhizobium zhengyangense]MCG2629717.1 hypothetical protein [Bradyrhizobium zhengyangense]
MARVFGWLWKRWSDYQSVVAILDVLDLKTAVGGFLSFFGMTFFGATNMQWSPPAVLLAGLTAAAVVSVTLVAFRIWLRMEPKKHTAKQNEASVAPTAPLDGDIDARAAFFRILESSQWRADQDVATDPKGLVYDWREVRLSTEIHNYLRNGQLAAWGEECLPGTASTPRKPIPPETWDRVAIHFDRSSAPRTAAHFRGRTSRAQGPMAWVGIQFSSAQMFDLYPLRRNQIPNRISSVELMKMAIRLGWNFSDQHSLELIDLQDAIRQGALDAQLTVWGKLNRWPNAPQLMQKEVLEKIPAEHFKDYRINLFAALENDNFHTYTWHILPSSSAEKGYLDLHVDRSEAANWLRLDALAFRGRTTTQTRV